jgi:NADH-quinone oxidoreductase subunit M
MSAMFRNLLSVILLTPLAGALVILLVNGRRIDAIRWVANAFAAAGFLLAVPLWFRYQPHGKTWQFAERGQWMPGIGAAYYVGVDGFSILLILLTTLMGWIAIVASWNDIKERVKEFYVLMLVMETGMLGAFMALDFLLFFLFWELILVSMCCLIGIRGHGSSARRFFLYTLAGSAVMWIGVLALYFHNHSITGAYSFDITQYQVVALPFTLQKWVFLAFFLGFALIVPMFPLHGWLPDAQTAAPTAGSVMLAAVLLKMGTYGFIRLGLPILPDASRYFVPAIATISIIGLVYAALVALAQSDWKRLLAYSSVSQMGLVMLGMFTLTPVGLTGSLVQQINHGISIGALFLIAGMVEERRQTRAIAEYGGLFKVTPVLATVFLIVTMSAIGVPALNGFIGERLILQGVYPVNRLWAAAAVAGIVVGAASLLRLYLRTMFGRLDNPANTALRDLTGREVAIFVPVIALALWIGLYPAPVLRRLETSVGRVVARANPAYAPYVAQGSDCATPAPADLAGPPPAFVLAAPCADDSEATAKPKPKSSGIR